MGGCMGQWVGSGQMTNLIKLELINIIWFCLKIYNLSRHPYLWVDGWVNGWAHVKPLKSNKSWPNRDNSIMDILDILLDILLKPPQPFIGLLLFSTRWFHHSGKQLFFNYLDLNTPNTYLRAWEDEGKILTIFFWSQLIKTWKVDKNMTLLLLDFFVTVPLNFGKIMFQLYILNTCPQTWLLS